MALLWIEGFEGFGETTGLAPAPSGIIARKYTGSGGVVGEVDMDINAGRYAGRCLTITDENDWITSPDLTTDDTISIGFAFKITAIPTNPSGLAFLRLNDQGTQGITIKVQKDTGKLIFYSGSNVLEVSSLALSIDTWYYFEMQVVAHNTTGSYEVRIDGDVWMSGSGVDTQNGSNPYHTLFRLEGGTGLSISFDDLYCLDSTTGLTGFQGLHKVVAINPSSDDTVTWDRSTGSVNADVVDDGLEMDDTDYVYTSATPEQDLYGYENLSGDVTIVRGVQVMAEADIDSGSLNLAQVVKSGTTTSVGANTLITPGDQTVVRVIEEDPDASADWTPTTLNAALFGIKAIAI